MESSATTPPVQDFALLPCAEGARVTLFGGAASGRAVIVHFLDDPVAIYRDWQGELLVRPVDAPTSEGDFLGTYQFVGPRGPEQPVLVHRSRLRRLA